MSAADFLAVLWHHTFFPPSSLMARRAAAEATGRFDPALSPGEDMDHYLRLLSVGRLAEVPEPLTFYRVHASQLSGDPSRQLRGWGRARGVMIGRHGRLLAAAGLRPDRLWDAHRNHVLLAFYRRQFRAARPLLWRYWREHPGDWRMLARWLVAWLPPRLVTRARGAVGTGPRPGQGTDPAAWGRTLREVAPALARPVAP